MTAGPGRHPSGRPWRHGTNTAPSGRSPADEIDADRRSDGRGGPGTRRGPGGPEAAELIGPQASVLPPQEQWLTGRDDDVAGVVGLLGQARVVCLTGPPGVGKTSVALAAGHALSGDGTVVYLFDLHSVPPRTVLTEPLDAVVDGGAILAVLDGCDVDEAASADLGERLVALHPDVRVLATGRQPLGLMEERVWRLAPLPVPAAGPHADVDALMASPSMQLLCARAEEVRAGFTLGPDNASVAASICRALEGNPLAIELAAFRLDAMTPAQVLSHLDDPLSFLRHRTPRGSRSLAETVERGLALLSPEERTLLGRLSVFADGFDLDAAIEIGTGDEVRAPDVADLLCQLVRVSLVVADTDGAEARYSLPAAVRVGARDLLERRGDEHLVRLRHARWCLDLAETHRTPSEASVERLQLESENIRAALGWAVTDGPADLARRMACATPIFWDVPDVRYWLDRALARDGGGPAVPAASALINAGYQDCQLGDLETAGHYAEEGLAMSLELGDDALINRALNLKAFLVVLGDGPATGMALMGDRLAEARASGDARTQNVLALCGRAYMFAGDAQAARTCFLEELDLADRDSDVELRQDALTTLGWASLALGDYDDAARLLEESRVLGESLEDRWSIALTLVTLGELALATGDAAKSEALFEEAAALARRAGSYFSLLRSLLGLGGCALAAGDVAAARGHFQDVAHRAGPGGLLSAQAVQGLGQAALADGNLTAANEALEEALATARQRGEQRAVGRILHDLGTLARLSGDDIRARSRFDEAVQQLWDVADVSGTIDTLDALGCLAAREGRDDVAARVLGAAQAARHVVDCTRMPVAVPSYDADLDHLRQSMPPAKLDEAWAEGAQLTPEEAVAYARRGRGSRRRPTSGWASLTPAELSVVRLAAEGLTNTEIGKRLFVSPRTVAAHLSHVFAKVGVASRRELAREAAQRTL